MLSAFWFKFNNNQFDRIDLTDEDRIETDGVCPTCPPPPGEKNKPAKKSGAAPSAVDAADVGVPVQITVKLGTCFHCGVKICDSCRAKHYTQQRQETIRLVEDNQTGCGNVAVVVGKSIYVLHLN